MHIDGVSVVLARNELYNMEITNSLKYYVRNQPALCRWPLGIETLKLTKPLDLPHT
jgi:hypothetical protein